MMVEAPGEDAGRVRDVTDGGRTQAALGEESRRDGQELLTSRGAGHVDTVPTKHLLGRVGASLQRRSPEPGFRASRREIEDAHQQATDRAGGEAGSEDRPLVGVVELMKRA